MTDSIIFRDLLGSLSHSSRLLLAVATPLEADAVLAPFSIARPQELQIWSPFAVSDRVDLVITGVGKAPAAAAVAAVLAAGRHGGVLNVGIAGSLPAAQELHLCSPIVASAHAFADEGVAIPSLEGTDSFLSLASMGFPPPGTSQDSVPGDSVWTDILLHHIPTSAFGPIATVSTCSGVDRLGRAVVARTGAIAEGMEGAAVALSSRNLGFHYAELRTISNTTGDRPGQVWDLRGALSRLGTLVAQPR